MVEKEEMFREELRFLHNLLESAKSADSVLTKSARAQVRDTVIKTMTENDLHPLPVNDLHPSPQNGWRNCQ